MSMKKRLFSGMVTLVAALAMMSPAWAAEPVTVPPAQGIIAILIGLFQRILS